jgi:hypothetical protein
VPDARPKWALLIEVGGTTIRMACHEVGSGAVGEVVRAPTPNYLNEPRANCEDLLRTLSTACGSLRWECSTHG